MKTQTKMIALGAVIMVLLTGIIVIAVFDDVEGPLIYQIDVLPTNPAPGDYIVVAIYCIDTSGVSGAELRSSINGEEWEVYDMQFFACLCISGGRWTARFGPVGDGDIVNFYATAFDESPTRNSADTQTFELEIQG